MRVLTAWHPVSRRLRPRGSGFTGLPRTRDRGVALVLGRFVQVQVRRLSYVTEGLRSDTDALPGTSSENGKCIDDVPDRESSHNGLGIHLPDCCKPVLKTAGLLLLGQAPCCTLYCGPIESPEPLYQLESLQHAASPTIHNPGTSTMRPIPMRSGGSFETSALTSSTTTKGRISMACQYCRHR